MSQPSVKTPHPLLYFILFLPFGATSGFVSVMMGWLASRAGIPDGTVAAMIAMNTLPHTWKFLWAPFVDILWHGRGWYIVSNFLSSAAIIAMGLVPMKAENIDILTALVFVNGVATTFVGMCTESLMAHLTPVADRARAASYSQAGNVGGTFVGGIALAIAEQTKRAYVPAIIVGLALLACSGALLTMPIPPRTHHSSMRQAFRSVGADIWSVVTCRSGIYAMILCFVPIGAGAASNLFAAMAPDWQASANVVSFSNGLGSGLGAIAGCIVAGKLATATAPRRAYAASGIILSIITFGMAMAPRNAAAYVIFVLGYNFGIGLCYATFSAFILEIIGKGAAATKYNIFASLANMPIYAMARIDGTVSDHHGRTAMLWVDGAAGVVGALLLTLAAQLLKSAPEKPNTSETAAGA